MSSIGRRILIGLIVLAAAVWSGCAAGITGLPGNVTATTAELRGTITTTTGGPVEHWFEYGPTTAYGSESVRLSSNVAAGSTQAVFNSIGGLERATTYHYRLCARDSQQGNALGCGVDRTVTTQSVDCGATITQDVKLTGSLDCSKGPGGGFTIGAPGVDVNLGNHSLTGFPTSVGIQNAGYEDVTIRNGSMFGWGTTIALVGASRNAIRDIEGSMFSVSGGEGNQIRRARGRFFIGSGGLVLADSEATAGFGARSSPAIRVASSGGRFVRNVVRGGPFEPGIVVDGDGNRIVESEFRGATKGCIAIASGQGNVVRENDVRDCPKDSAGNEGADVGDGIFVAAAATGTVLRSNLAAGNGDDGIDSRSASTRFLENQATGNADFGIDAVPGVSDLGGNTASGNGNPLQCRNVFCG